MTRNYDEMKLGDIAPAIHAYLVKFEADNGPGGVNEPTYYASAKTGKPEQNSSSFYWASAHYSGGSKLMVIYVSYQGSHNLSKADALEYLRWLDAGNVGSHIKMRQKGSYA